MKVLIVGAGEAGQKIAREIALTQHPDITVIGYVDDDPAKQGTCIADIEVIGVIDDIPVLIAQGIADQVLVAMPSTDIVPRLSALVPPGFPVKVLPSISSVILGHVDWSYVRDIDASDLIGRPLVKTDQMRIASHVRGKSFLVTGGAGSIGSEIVRQLFSSGAGRIIILDSWEEGMFNLLEEMKASDGNKSHRVIGKMGNIRDRERIDEILREYHVDAIFHAAAYKHVPLLEDNPQEAIKTNTQGTENVIQAALQANIKDFVLISTDKAVRPTSVLGKTKREAELLMQWYARENPQAHLCAVRFGNVFNSSGSVIRTFLRQIRGRLPVTITHKDMTRYFMSIPEAVSLVLTAWIISKNGEILLLDMGKPVKIMDLVESLARMHGLVLGDDIPLVEIGLRPGEKIHEELAYDMQRLQQSSAPRVFVAERLE